MVAESTSIGAVMVAWPFAPKTKMPTKAQAIMMNIKITVKKSRGCLSAWIGSVLARNRYTMMMANQAF